MICLRITQWACQSRGRVNESTVHSDTRMPTVNTLDTTAFSKNPSKGMWTKHMSGWCRLIKCKEQHTHLPNHFVSTLKSQRRTGKMGPSRKCCPHKREYLSLIPGAHIKACSCNPSAGEQRETRLINKLQLWERGGGWGKSESCKCSSY